MEVVAVSTHAVNRYRRRCGKETLPWRECRRQLLELAQRGEFVTEKPAWVERPRGRTADPVGYVIVVDSLALPVSRDGLVTTVLVRGSGSPERLEKRRKGRRAKRGYLRSKGGSSGGQGIRGRRPDAPLDPEYA